MNSNIASQANIYHQTKRQNMLLNNLYIFIEVGIFIFGDHLGNQILKSLNQGLENEFACIQIMINMLNKMCYFVLNLNARFHVHSKEMSTNYAASYRYSVIRNKHTYKEINERSV